MKQYLEAGKIVATHGIRGEVRIEPWCDSADFIARLRRFYRADRQCSGSGKLPRTQKHAAC